MRIFTCTRNPSKSPKRRVPVISAPSNFQHRQHRGPDEEMNQPISAQIGFQLVQHASVGAEMNQSISPPSGFQHVQHVNPCGEMQSISQVMNMRAPAIPPSGADLNGFVSNPSMKATPVRKTPIQFDKTMRKLMNRKTRVHMRMNPKITVPSPNDLRSAYSTPELGDSDIPQNIARLRPVRSRQSTAGISSRRSWFTVTTGIIEGRRTLIRKVLDTFGCTKVDQFNIYEFEPVTPRARTVVPSFRSTEREFALGRDPFLG